MIRKTVDLLDQPVLYIAALGWYDGLPKGSDCFSPVLLPWARDRGRKLALMLWTLSVSLVVTSRVTMAVS